MKNCPHCGAEDASPVPVMLKFECGTHFNELLSEPYVLSVECRLRAVEDFIERSSGPVSA